MDVPSYFRDFMSGIRLTSNQITELKTGHSTLRKRLLEDEKLSEIIVSTFLQGSYRRSTAVRPKGELRSDVDIIVVTKLSMDEYSPEEAMDVFIPFMDKYYKGKYRIQGRSIGISLSYIDMDIVITAAPSEGEIGILKSEDITSDSTIEDLNESNTANRNMHNIFLQSRVFNEKTIFNGSDWKINPLFIPDRDAEEWQATHPLEQIRWTREKNSLCNGHYVNVVKALKWWRKEKFSDIEQPKSYPFEHFIGQSCPDGIVSVASGITYSLEKIVSEYSYKPVLPDHGVPEHDVFARLTVAEYMKFYESVCVAAKIAREALDSNDIQFTVNKWRELFGNKFPPAPDNQENNKNGFTDRTDPSNIKGGRFA